MSDYSQELRELFSRLGQQLREAREAQGLSILDIAAQTRINQNFLQMIEKGDLDHLPSLAFVKGFVRNFSQVVGLEQEEIEGNLSRLNVLDKGEDVPELTPSNRNLLDIQPTRPPIFKMAMWAVLGVLILVAGYLLFRPSASEGPEIAQETTLQEEPAPEIEGGEATQGEKAPSSEPAPDGRAAQTQSPVTLPPSVPPAGGVVSRQKLELTIRGLERTWVRLSLDRAPPIDVLMEPAETVGWEATQEIRLTVGKSHGVAVYLNGEEIILPQQKNRLIRNLVLNKLTLLRLEN